VTAARLAIDAIAELLEAGGVTASRDASGFDPAPIGVLLGLPTLVGRTLSGATFDVPIVIVSGDPVNTAEAVDRLYAEADAIAEIVSTSSYRPSTWAGSSRTQPLPAIEVSAIVTVSIEEG
jgi:hypothetical protein